MGKKSVMEKKFVGCRRSPNGNTQWLAGEIKVFRNRLLCVFVPDIKLAMAVHALPSGPTGLSFVCGLGYCL